MTLWVFLGIPKKVRNLKRNYILYYYTLESGRVMLVGWAVCSSSPENNRRGDNPEGVEADGVHFPSTVKYIYVILIFNISYIRIYIKKKKRFLTWCARDPP